MKIEIDIDIKKSWLPLELCIQGTLNIDTFQAYTLPHTLEYAAK